MVLFLTSDIPFNGSLFDIPDEPSCYVRQFSLYAYLILISLYEMCLRQLHYITLYALSLHSTFAHLWVLAGIRQLALCKVINSNFHYIYNSNRNLFIIVNMLFTCVIEIHKALLI